MRHTPSTSSCPGLPVINSKTVRETRKRGSCEVAFRTGRGGEDKVVKKKGHDTDLHIHDKLVHTRDKGINR